MGIILYVVLCSIMVTVVCTPHISMTGLCVHIQLQFGIKCNLMYVGVNRWQHQLQYVYYYRCIYITHKCQLLIVLAPPNHNHNLSMSPVYSTVCGKNISLVSYTTQKLFFLTGSYCCSSAATWCFVCVRRI